MTINLDLIGACASIVSLVFAVLFWFLAKRQADDADVTLREIKIASSDVKDKMLAWQNDLNNAAIGLIQARPEVIAEKVSLEEAKSHTLFAQRLAGLIEQLAKEADSETTAYKIALIKELLDHYRQFAHGSEQIKANAVFGQSTKKNL